MPTTNVQCSKNRNDPKSLDEKLKCKQVICQWIYFEGEHYDESFYWSVNKHTMTYDHIRHAKQRSPAWRQRIVNRVAKRIQEAITHREILQITRTPINYNAGVSTTIVIVLNIKTTNMVITVQNISLRNERKCTIGKMSDSSFRFSALSS